MLTGDPAGRFGAGLSGQYLRECPPSSAIGQQISCGGSPVQTPRSRGGSSRAELGVFGLQAADPLVLTVSGSRARQTSSSTPQPVRVVVGPAQLLSASWWGKGCRRPEQRPAMPAQRGPGPTTVHAAAAAGSAARRTCPCPALSHPRAPATPRGGSSCPLRKSSERRPCRRSELEVFRYCARLRRPRRLAKKLQLACTSCLPSGTRPRRWAAPPRPHEASTPVSAPAPCGEQPPI